MEFDTIVFAGGGNRCFWQAGFWRALEPALEKPPQRLLGVSAGAIVACGIQAGVVDRLLDHNRSVFDANPRNFHVSELLRGRNPFPHPRIVSTGVETVFDRQALQRLRSGTPVHVLAAVLPDRLPTVLASATVQVSYLIERRVGRTLHGNWGTRIGFAPHWHAVQRCESAAELRDVLVASSAIPPAFGVQRLGGRRMMDGGFVGNALIEFEGEDPGRRLVLVTREDWAIPVPREDLVYVRPSRKVPVTKLDATSGARIQAAFDLGFEDGQRFVRMPNCA
ncbi:MAG: patatin-like phospholipase family protein [Pseudomonadales bacterium]|nr:patatin-like phospholipase family protein [Pseudomonadales bacterium]